MEQWRHLASRQALINAALGKPLGTFGDNNSNRVSPTLYELLVLCAHGEECGLGCRAGLECLWGWSQNSAGDCQPNSGVVVSTATGDHGWVKHSLCPPALPAPPVVSDSTSGFLSCTEVPLSWPGPGDPPGRSGRASGTCTCLHGGRGHWAPSRAQAPLPQGDGHTFPTGTRRALQGEQPASSSSSTVLSMVTQGEGRLCPCPPRCHLPGQQLGLVLPGGVLLADHHLPCPSPPPHPMLCPGHAQTLH